MTDVTEPMLLSTGSVGRYLRDRGLIESDDDIEAVELGGGVSNVVIAVRSQSSHESSDAFRAVVKQSLPRLRVADEWLAKRERVLNEARALDLLGQLTPGRIPRVLDVDPGEYVVTIERAPDDWCDWKRLLLAGHVDARVAGDLGRLLAGWHAGTSGAGAVPPELDDPEAFEQLRVDPFYRTIAARRTEVAAVVERYADEMLATRRCLVHGDYSPKNVMVPAGGAHDGLWVLDLEVAHLGDPVFDLAFMVAHLTLKAIHMPAHLAALRACVTAFWDGYVAEMPDHLASTPQYVLGHVGCILMARVDGKSPAEYLTQRDRDTARELGRLLAEEPRDDVAQAWEILERVRS